jgi:hypothetical protein
MVLLLEYVLLDGEYPDFHNLVTFVLKAETNFHLLKIARWTRFRPFIYATIGLVLSPDSPVDSESMSILLLP